MWPVQALFTAVMGLLLVCPNNAQEVCSNGVPGVEGFGVCCAAECGTCGGVNCQGRAEAIGLTADFCCAGRISDSGVYCEDFGTAPCIIAPTCSNGMVGVEDFGVCCMAECGTCGGAGCRHRAEAAGLDAHDCCSQRIKDSGVYCDHFETAPCIIHEGTCEPSLVITLDWSDGSSDVDLYVIEPDGTVVSYERPLGSFGFLDDEDENGFGPENYIILSGLDPDNSPVLGVYQAQARLFDGPTESWNLTARSFGETVLVVEGDFTTSNTTQYFNVSLTSYDPNCGGRFAA